MPPPRLPRQCVYLALLAPLSVVSVSLPSAASSCAHFDFSALAPSPGAAEALFEPVQFAMQTGLLQPQLEQLLQQQFSTEVVDWQVSPHFRWPADYSLQAPSWHELLERLLKPYQLTITLHPNKSATVRYARLAGARL